MADISKAGRGTGPVFDRRVFRVVQSLSLGQAQGSYTDARRFLDTYERWLRQSSVATVSGLESFFHRYPVHGVTEAYDCFFREHRGRRFRTLLGEYPYTPLSVPNFLHVEDDELRENDALVVSCPHYLDGRAPRGYSQLLDRCQQLGVPVLVDAAYFGTCYGVYFDYSHPAIEMLGFSLSKSFSVQSHRIGVLYSRRALGNLEALGRGDTRVHNTWAAFVGMELMSRFNADFMPNMHREAHQRVCRELDLIPSACIMLANVRDEDRRFDEVLKDERFEPRSLPEGALRRVCVSDYLGYRGTIPRRLASRLVRSLRA